MNILMPTFDFSAESARFIRTEAEAFARAGARVRALTIHSPREPLHEKITNRLEVVRFRYFWPEDLEKLRRPGEPLYNVKSILSFVQIPIVLLIFSYQIFKYALQADIIYCQWTITALLALPVKWILKKKIVVIARGSDLRLLPAWLNRFLHRQVDAALDCYGPQAWNEQYKKDFPANFIKLPLIVTQKYQKHRPKDLPPKKNFWIFIIGRFDQFKINEHQVPFFDLLHAAKKLKKYKNKFHIFYIGDGDEEIKSKISKQISQLEIADNVTLLGWKNNVSNYLPYCDLGIGGVAMNTVCQEYSMHKIPQLMVKGGPNKKTLWRNKVNAIFFENGQPESIVKAITYAMDNRPKIKKIGQNGYKFMSQYVTTVKHGGTLYLRVFQKLIDC